MTAARTRLLLLTCLLAVIASPFTPAGEKSEGAADPLAPMKFNEVREIAPGVFFRFSSISATDKTITFGGSNNIWVVFEDYVLVYDANFPKEAGDVVAAIRTTTDKPIRYVLDSHHHGDHAYGNAVFAKAGATIVAQANCARWLREKGPKEFAAAGRGANGRKDVAESSLKVPSIVFDDKLVLDDGKQRAELLFLGHAHTPGDALLYLPRHKVLCTGDACVNGAFNYTGHSDTASWVRVMERAQQLDVKLICPGHGPLAGKDLLGKQRRYFAELRQQVRKGLDAGLEMADLVNSIQMPWYKEWTGVEASSRRENIQHVYGELTGSVLAWDLLEEFGLTEGPSPTKNTPGWTKPRRIVVPNLMPARLAEFKRIAPDIEFVPVKTEEEAVKAVADADAVFGLCSPEIVKAGKQLRWIQLADGDEDKQRLPEVLKGPIALISSQQLHGPNVADQAFALLLGLTRGLRAPTNVKKPPPELHGKTLLLVGLQGAGGSIARRGHSFGMRVLAIDPRETERPGSVFSLNKPDRLVELLPQADVVMLVHPPAKDAQGLIGEVQLRAMKPTAYLISVAGGSLIKTGALAAALKDRQLAGAGLDVTEPESLPEKHPLRTMPNVLLSPGAGMQSPEIRERQWRLWRENLRRFVAGEPLLAVLDRGD